MTSDCDQTDQLRTQLAKAERENEMMRHAIRKAQQHLARHLELDEPRLTDSLRGLLTVLANRALDEVAQR